MNSLYRFCSEPPEVGGSLICSCRGNNNIHIGQRVLNGELADSRNQSVNRTALEHRAMLLFFERRLVVLRTRSKSYSAEMLARMLDLVCQQS